MPISYLELLEKELYKWYLKSELITINFIADEVKSFLKFKYEYV